MGEHIGNAIKMILYTVDPERVILGGSVSLAWPYFKQTMWKRIRTAAYSKSSENFSVNVSELDYGGILGACALCYAGLEIV